MQAQPQLRDDPSAGAHTGLPLDIILSVRFLAQLTTAQRAAAVSGQGQAGTMLGDEWASPRGKVRCAPRIS